METTLKSELDTRSKLLIGLVLMASGRAMTLAFIGRAGDGGAGDPPEEWLAPLIGDAVIGVTALGVAWLIWKRPSPASWLISVVWTVLGALDAVGAFLVELANPWPEFFMLKIFGRSMFFAAAAMHMLILYLLIQPSERARHRPFGP